MSQILGH